MKIPHLSKPQQSQFYQQVAAALGGIGREFPIQVQLRAERSGYKGSHEVSISEADELEFEADADLADWTRFPARIRAAATALRGANFLGRFTITHCEGQLTIDRLEQQ